ncbi:MAG: DUF1109 domain-containing protein [Pacificimonas sp.]
MNDLLDRLADDATPVRRVNAALFVTLFGGGFIASLLMVIGFQGVRPDLLAAGGTAIFAWKLLACASVAALSAILLMKLGKPGQAPPMRGVSVAGLALLVFALPFAAALIAEPAAQAAVVTRGSWVLSCLTGIAMATSPLWIMALIWLKRSAPTDIEQASWAAGLASGSAGATAFVLHCPFDQVAYVGLWYLAAILGIAAISRLVLPRLIRW